MGRPKKPESEKLVLRALRMTPAEWAAVDVRAKARGWTSAQWVRDQLAFLVGRPDFEETQRQVAPNGYTRDVAPEAV